MKKICFIVRKSIFYVLVIILSSFMDKTDGSYKFYHSFSDEY
jgi:hypothetical protein